MKRIIYFIAFVLAYFTTVQAQVERSVQPQPGPAPVINLGKPQTFELPNGLTVMVVENHKLPRVTFSLTLDNPLDLEGDIKGVSAITSSMMGNGTSRLSKEEFNEQLDYYGANVTFEVTNVYGSTLSRYFPQVLTLAAQGALDPLFTEEELESERAKWLDLIKAGEKSAQEIAERVSKTLLYGKNHPKGEYYDEETLNRITLNDVKNYYTTNFVPGNGYLVVIGDVKFDDVRRLVTENFSSWQKAYAPKSDYTEPVNLTRTEINFVDVPNAVQSEIYVMNVTNLKMTDPDYFATLLANQILGGGGEGRLFLNLREAHGWTYGAYSGIRGDRYVSHFSASTSVRNAVTDSAVVEILNEINSIRNELPTQEELELAKAKYVGNFVMNTEKPQTIASYALAEKLQSLPADFYENYIRNVNAVTLEEVQAAAQKYFHHNGARILVVGKASEVLQGLESLNLPVSYYDKYGNPTAKPEKVQVDASVTPRMVLEKYIEAIGGREKLENVKTIMITATADMQGNEITVLQKATADGKSMQEMSVMGMTMMKTAYNGKTGYMVIQGQRNELGEKEIESMKYSVPFPELLLINSSASITGVENSSYVLQLDDKTYYYDMNTGLKTAEAATQEIAPGQTMTQLINLSDYRDVQGIKIPYKSTTDLGMGMEMEMNVTDIKINEGVSDSDFE